MLFGLRPKFPSFSYTIFETRGILRVSKVCLSPLHLIGAVKPIKVSLAESAVSVDRLQVGR